MTKTVDDVVSATSQELRHIVHDINNALFVSKGFLEELSEDIKSKRYIEDNFDHENFLDIFETVSRNVEKIDKTLVRLRKFAKEDIFDIAEVEKLKFLGKDCR